MRVGLHTVGLLALLGCASPDARTASRPRPTPARVDPAAPSSPSVAPSTSPSSTVSVAAGCDVRVLAGPAVPAPPLTWGPCAEGPQGCREATSAAGSSPFGRGFSLQGLVRGDEVTVAVLELVGTSARYTLGLLDGPAFLAIEGPRGEACSLATLGLSDDGAVVEVIYDARDGYASRAYLRGPLGPDGTWSRVAAVLERHDYPDFIGEAVLPLGGHVALMAAGGPVRWFDPHAARWNEVAGSHDGWACCAQGRADAVTFLLETIPERAMVARLGGSARELRPPIPGGGTSAIAVDGSQAAWIEGRGRDRNNHYLELDLWRAELSSDLTLTGAHVVTRLARHTMAQPRLGGGVVAFPLRDQSSDLALVRLDTGEMRSFTPPAGLAVVRVLWLTTQEVGVELGPRERTLGPSTIRRFPIDSLPRVPRT